MEKGCLCSFLPSGGMDSNPKCPLHGWADKAKEPLCPILNQTDTISGATHIDMLQSIQLGIRANAMTCSLQEENERLKLTLKRIIWCLDCDHINVYTAEHIAKRYLSDGDMMITGWERDKGSPYIEEVLCKN